MMDRGGLKGILVVLTLIGVIAPASERFVTAPARSADAVNMVSPNGALSSEELQRAYAEMSRASESAPVKPVLPRSPRTFQGVRDPFALPVPVVILPPMAPSLPSIRLLGVIAGREGVMATVEVDGASETLRIGDSARGVKVIGVKPPDEAEVEVSGSRMVIKVE